MTIYTIGFTKKTAEQFYEGIKSRRIKLLIDIRLRNDSQLMRFSHGEDMAYFLKKLCSCKYEHCQNYAPSDEILDGWKKKSITWPEYEKRYSALMIEREAVKDFYERFGKCKNVCLLCSEDTPEYCHRRLFAEMIASEIPRTKIIHITGNTADIVILAKRAAHIAGIDINSGKWMRFTAGNDWSYEPLDVVRTEITEIYSDGNCRIKPMTMHKLGTYTINDVMRMHMPEQHDYIFGNESNSLSKVEMREHSFSSLFMFVWVKNLKIDCHKLKASFDYNGRHYDNMSITDPDYAKNGIYYEISLPIDSAYLVISMSSKAYFRNGRYYKFIDKIFLP